MDISEIYSVFKKSTGVCTDTRVLIPGNLFFALKGPNFNANSLANEALEKGAVAVVLDDPSYRTKNTILVNDGLTALQELARFHRDQFKIPVIGITGSNGKTTTKELIAATLAKKYKIHCTKGNLNNHIGVPLTILSMTDATEIAIIEMGANHIGEIAQLCTIANPNYGIITNIGRAHLEGFGSFEGVAKAKSELYYHLLNNGGNIFVNSGDEHLMRMAGRFEHPITFPGSKDYYHCELRPGGAYLEIKTENSDFFQTLLTGSYNFPNAAAALCIAKYFEVDWQLAEEAIREYQPSNNRSQVIKKGENTIILDAYNANPSSMQAAIQNFDQIDARHKIVIAGDMFELGRESVLEHSNFGKLLSETNINLILLCGSEMYSASRSCPNAQYFQDKPALERYLKENKFDASTILIKGSRGMRLETLVEFI